MTTKGHRLRQSLFGNSAKRLADMACRLIHTENQNPSELVMVVIYVDDPAWTDIAKELMPGHDYEWQKYRAQGQMPIAQGAVSADSIQGYISSVVPALAEPIKAGPPDRHLFAFVLGGGGASLYAVPYDPQIEA